MTPDYRALCAELLVLAEESPSYRVQAKEAVQLIDRARALLAEADGPAVPDGREPASVATQPSDAELDELAWTWYSKTGSTWCQIEAFRAYARAVLARWGRPAAAPVPETEAEGPSADEWDALVKRAWDEYETVGYLGERFMYDSDFGNALDFVRRELARWGRPAAAPVPVSERLPEPNVKVLAYYFNALGNGRTICAIWVPAKSRSDEGDLDADDFLEYDEEGDTYYWPEGWYEAIENWDELGWVKVTGFGPECHLDESDPNHATRTII